jgi:steroid 5-alpha reductase family enzyme
MSPLIICLWVLAAVCALTWILSLITNEHSWVDRIWSIVPVAYVWIFAGAAGLSDLRLNVMAVVVTAWGIRLTANFTRKGGYAPGGEDYRWEFLRTKMPRFGFALFNLFFIVIYQNAILLLITLPAFTAYLNPRPFGVPDVVATVVFLAFLAGETIADQQQWNFQQHKKAVREAGRVPEANFATTGLFRYSRHPNFFFEQAQWWVIFAFGAIAAGSVFEWTILGAALLTILFIGSTVFTESISKSRYPEYADYQHTTSPMIPWFPRGHREEATA